jgi:hypothetical protein
MNRVAPAVTAAAIVLLGGTYVMVRARAGATEPFPRWSCNHQRPPVAEVPASLIARAGFRDRAELQGFVEKNEAALHWTYFAVQSGLQATEAEVMGCFQRRWNGMTPVGPSSVEARLVWHLTSDGKTAVADTFELAVLNGPDHLTASARACLEQHLLGRAFELSRPSNHDFIKHKGVFPFHRKLRFSVGRPVSVPGPGSRSLAPS